jgi:FtsZ-binding cell division protein ZapB
VIETKARARPHAVGEPPVPAIIRPAGLPHATKPGEVPEPFHRHLPAWVRRTFAKARPVLADLLGTLEGDELERFIAATKALTDLIGTGKFSKAFEYPQLIATGMQLFEQQRKEQADSARLRRVVDAARRRISERLRDAAAQLSPEVSSRLNKAVRAAADQEAIAALEVEVIQAVESARSVQERRREREISRTKTKIERSSVKTAPAEEGDTWQDVLRRLHDQMAAEQVS